MSVYTQDSLAICLKIVRSINAESGVWGPNCVVIGGLVPALLDIEPPEGLKQHIGTTDVDLGIQVAALADEPNLYRTLKSVLTKLKFKQTQHEPSFAWTREVDGFMAKVELFCPVSDQSDAGTILKKPFEKSGSGLTALGVYGLENLTKDLVVIESEGDLLDDVGVKKVPISVCGPAMLMVLKAWALKERTKLKDGYDVVWLLKALGPDVLARKYLGAELDQSETGARALGFLEESFSSIEHTGPVGWVAESGFVGEAAVLQKREAVGLVNEFCKKCREPQAFDDY